MSDFVSPKDLEFYPLRIFHLYICIYIYSIAAGTSFSQGGF